MPRIHRGSWSRYEEREFFVYLIGDADGDVLYIGRSCRPEQRWRNHLQRKAATWTTRAARFKKLGPFYYPEAFVLERELIELHEPVGNVMHTAKMEPVLAESARRRAETFLAKRISGAA